ncbi:MAG: hypothetical protein FWE18_05705 [Alphaproteobacteria bacterium]|nr:hypothetical protein [Alphaproteobacteria bacterium]
MRVFNLIFFTLIITINIGFAKSSSADEYPSIGTVIDGSLDNMTAFLNTGVKTEVDESKFLPYASGAIIDGFLENGFVISNRNNESRPFIVLNQRDSSDIGVRIYAQSQMAKANGIFIIITLNSNTANTENDKNRRPLNEETFQKLRNALSLLNCRDNVDFLRSGFVCNNEYEVLYSINSDNFDGFRRLFGMDRRSELLISITPVAN